MIGLKNIYFESRCIYNKIYIITNSRLGQKLLAYIAGPTPSVIYNVYIYEWIMAEIVLVGLNKHKLFSLSVTPITNYPALHCDTAT